MLSAILLRLVLAINRIDLKFNDKVVKGENGTFVEIPQVSDLRQTSAQFRWIAGAKNAPTGYGVARAFSSLGDFQPKSQNWINVLAFGTDHSLYFCQNINAGSWSSWGKIYHSGMIDKENIAVASISSGTNSYRKTWRKLTATLPTQAGEIRVAHGANRLEIVQINVLDADGFIVSQNDPDPTRQFIVREKNGHLHLIVAQSATKIFGKTATIYLGEER